MRKVRVTQRQVLQMTHILAAANHRQRALWARFVVPALEAGEHDFEWLKQGQLPTELRLLLRANVRVVVQIVKKVVGDFACTEEPVIRRKMYQLVGWVSYAVLVQPQDFEQWKQRCLTPFIQLSWEQRRTNYTEAVADLLVIAQAGGLLLPEPLPPIAPQTQRSVRHWRLQHIAGMHAPFEVSETPQTLTCLACSTTRAVDRM